MKAYIFGFEPQQGAEKRAIVLESPAIGYSNGISTGTPYRFVLLPDGDGYTQKPILRVEQQYKSGDWGSCGGGWYMSALADHESDTISLQGSHWHASGLQAALAEAKAIMGL